MDYQELLKQRDALAETIRSLRDVVTHDAETKEDFIARVRAVLGEDPDSRVAWLGLYREALTRAISLPKGELPKGQGYYTWLCNGNAVVEPTPFNSSLSDPQGSLSKPG